MMDMDLSEVILDPTVAGDSFIVLRRRTTTNDFGEGQLPPPVKFEAVGSVTPTGNNSLVREDAYQSQSDTIRVITQFALRGAGRDEEDNEFQPDQVIWEGTTYLVITTNEYGRGGTYFTEAECATQEFQRSFVTPQ